MGIGTDFLSASRKTNHPFISCGLAALVLETKQVAHLDEELALRHQAWRIYPVGSALRVEREVFKTIVVAHVDRSAWVQEIGEKNVGSDSLRFVEIYELIVCQDGVVVENRSQRKRSRELVTQLGA